MVPPLLLLCQLALIRFAAFILFLFVDWGGDIYSFVRFKPHFQLGVQGGSPLLVFPTTTTL